MARSFSNVKAISTFFARDISPSVVARRTYAAAASQSKTLSSGASSNVISHKGTEESVKVSWVPDPVTGYYRPENGANETDPAELRAMLVKNKTTRN